MKRTALKNLIKICADDKELLLVGCSKAVSSFLGVYPWGRKDVNRDLMHRYHSMSKTIDTRFDTFVESGFFSTPKSTIDRVLPLCRRVGACMSPFSFFEVLKYMSAVADHNINSTGCCVSPVVDSFYQYVTICDSYCEEFKSDIQQYCYMVLYTEASP